jgi:hypothetical protein
MKQPERIFSLAYVITTVRKNRKPPGLEKIVDQKFYLDKYEADRVCEKMSNPECYEVLAIELDFLKTTQLCKLKKEKR